MNLESSDNFAVENIMENMYDNARHYPRLGFRNPHQNARAPRLGRQGERPLQQKFETFGQQQEFGSDLANYSDQDDYFNE